MRTAKRGVAGSRQPRSVFSTSVKQPLVLAFTLALTALALAAGPALAARGHEFGSTFGTPGSGKGQFDHPAGVAVSEATGDVYVVDEGNDRVERFSADGKYLGEFDGSGTFETEVGGKVEVQTGAAAPAGKFDEPRSVAVDNACVQQRPKLIGSACESFDESAGDVYVADGIAHNVVDKFTATGEYVGQILIPATPAPVEILMGVAVDSHGDLWVSDDRYEITFGFDKFSNGLVNEHVAFVNDRGKNLGPGLAVGSDGSLFADTVFEAPFEEVVAKFSATGQLLSAALDEETSAGVAVELPRGDVYVNNLATVARFGPDGSVVERFGEGHLPGLGEVFANYRSGVAVDGVSGTVYVTDAVDGDVVVFPLEGPKPPTVEGVSVSDVTADSATFEAVLNPRGARSEYRFEYGVCASLRTCASSGFEASVPAAGEPEAVVGGALDFESSEASIHPQGLLPGTTYHFRVLVHNEKNQSGAVVEGEERTFTTQSSAPFELLDGRGWEMVSPAQKHGTLIKAILVNDVIQAAAGGDAFTYVTSSPTEDQPQGFSNTVQVLSRRTSGGWVSEDLGLAHARATGVSVGEGGEYRLFSEDLSLGLAQPFGVFEPATSPEASEQTPYLRSDFVGGSVENGCVGGCYRPLVTAANVKEGIQFGEEGECPHLLLACGPKVVGASPDAEHVVLSSNVGLTAVAGDKGGLYEWNDGVLSLVSVLPKGEPAPLANPPQLGGNGVTRGAVSADGSRVVWSDGGHLYMRALVGEQTVMLDQGLVGAAEFQAASADDSRVFFTVAGELYVYEVEKGKALRLTVPVGVGERAEVQGEIAGVSEDGAYVYFVANGKLTSQAEPVAGGCNGQLSTSVSACYLYEDRETGGVWETPRVVAVLSGADNPDFAGTLERLTARVSPDGQWLVFMSQQSLTGYDNRDAASGVKDEEVFLFDAASDRLVCASCNPTGARPHGVEYGREGNGEAPDMPLAGGDRVWPASAWLAANVPGWTPWETRGTFYQSRYLLNDGRVFFNSHDALVGQDTNGTEDVYEYEPAGVGSCTSATGSFSERSGGCVSPISSGASREESAFLDASASGSDVFFLTTSKLVSSDFDTALDVYDARECSTSSPCLPEPAPPAPPCTTEASCKASPTPQPEIFGPPASATFSGLGNVPPATPVSKPRAKALTRAQKLANALGACHKLKKRARRAGCEKAANRRFGSLKAKRKGKR